MLAGHGDVANGSGGSNSSTGKAAAATAVAMGLSHDPSLQYLEGLRGALLQVGPPYARVSGNSPSGALHHTPSLPLSACLFSRSQPPKAMHGWGM